MARQAGGPRTVESEALDAPVRYRGHVVSVVIPCHNEEEGLAEVLARVPSEVAEILVLDNCSTDRTVAVARAAGRRVRVLCHPSNLGYGGSYRRGFRAVTGDVVVTTDGDGTYPIHECLRLVDLLIDRELDFLNCSRFPLRQPASMSRRNRIGNGLLNLAIHVLFGIRLQDGQSGMWVLRTSVLPALDLTCTGMSFSNEIKIEAFTKLGHGAAETGIPYAGRVGHSKLFPFRDGVRMASYLLFRRFGGPRAARAGGSRTSVVLRAPG